MAKSSRYTDDLVKEYLEKGYWENTTWSDIWDRNAANIPNREAIADARRRLTWFAAKTFTDRLALGLLKLGFKKDDVLVMQIPNSVELALLRIACEKAGVICTPILRTFRQAEVEYILKYMGAPGIVIRWRFRDFDYYGMIELLKPKLPALKHVLVAGDVVPQGAVSIEKMLKDPVENSYPPNYLQGTRFKATEISWIRHTSGSTGFPKFIEIPTSALMNLSRNYVELFKLTENDVFAALSPAFGGPNSIVYWPPALVGARTVMLEHFEAEAALSLIAREKVTIAGVVPAMFNLMMTHPNRDKYDLSSVRLWLSAGALSYDMAAALEKKCGCKVIDFYGVAEWGGSVLPRPEDELATRVLTVGRPLPGHDMKIVNDSGGEVARGSVGEVFLRGPAGVGGYYKDAEATWKVWTKDGWFRSGDLGKLDTGGNLVIVGRKKEMIRRGGENIYPVEIEAILAEHPGIAAAAVVGIPDPIMGEKCCAYVVPRTAQSLSLTDIVAYLKSKNIAAYKLPERLEVVDRFPTVADGQKVDKKRLAEDIKLKLERERLTSRS